MADALGWRRKFAVLVPSTNTVVQPEFDGMRPQGVTNHISRIRIPNMPLASDADFRLLVERIAAAQLEAVDSAMSCEPDHVVLGISVETFWGGREASRKLKQELEDHTALEVTMGAEACDAAFARLGVKRIAVLTRADAEGKQLIEEARTAAARVHAEETRKAIAAAEQILVRAQDTIVRDRAQMLAELKREVGRLVVQTTAAVTGKVLTPEDHRRLAEETARRLTA